MGWLLLLAWLPSLSSVHAATHENDRILNRPYADMKKIHFGFSVGMNFQNLAITNNAMTTDDGEQWFAEVPAHSPGFSVNVMGDYRLGKHLNLRLSPGMYFGNKVVHFINALGDANNVESSHYKQRQNIKSTYIVVPLDLKVSALRYHNLRPYFTGGAMFVYDLGKEHSEQLRLNRADYMLTVGLGCDFYLPFFKLCPEIKFCFGLKNIINRNRTDLTEDPYMLRFTESIDKITNNMVVINFFFE